MSGCTDSSYGMPQTRRTKSLTSRSEGDNKYIESASAHTSTNLKPLSYHYTSKPAGISPTASSRKDEEPPPLELPGSSETISKWARLGFVYTQRRILLHLCVFLVSTSWWVASLLLHRKDKNWVLPFLLWLVINLRLLFFHVPARYIVIALWYIWNNTAVRVSDTLPQKLHAPAGGMLFLAVLLVGAMVSEEFEDNNRQNRVVSLFGMFTFLAIFYITSHSRKHVKWRTVVGGMLGQYVIGNFVLRTAVGYSIFRWVSETVAQGLGYSQQGVIFLTDPTVPSYGWFILIVIPAIIFFISMVQVLFHYGYIQWAIIKLAVFVNWALQVSGSEAIVAAATPFIGQGESAMLVRPFMPYMTKAEIHQILTCGFATISGSVLVGYIQLGLNGEVLVSSCIMSIPASIAISKLRYPETEETLTAGKVILPHDEKKAENGLHAFANGTWIGLKIGATVVASLLCVLSAVALMNGLLGWLGSYLNINSPQLSLQLILGYVLYPVAFLLGIPRHGDELLKVSRLIAQKIVTNEYVAFKELSTEAPTLSLRSQLIAAFALAGFGNIGSLGLAIGVLSQLAPERSGDVSKLAVSALISGIVSTLTSATVAGLVLTSETNKFTASS